MRAEDLEQRLDDDEARLARDEHRLTQDEARLESEEDAIRESREVAWAGLVLALALALAVAALVMSIVALRHDVGSLGRRSAPAGSVSAAALQPGSVTADKLAPGAVGRQAIAAGAVGTEQIAHNAITGALVAPDTLTGADIRERTLGPVRTASNALRLDGVRAGEYLSQPFEVTTASVTDPSRTKGPLIARCPTGSRVVSGGATIEGAARGAALVDSSPADRTGWMASARVTSGRAPSWRLSVTAICAAGNE